MDYWEYLAHGQKGAERDDHRYYARELVGNRGGKNVYRYFYSAEEYASYKKAQKASFEKHLLRFFVFTLRSSPEHLPQS